MIWCSAIQPQPEHENFSMNPEAFSGIMPASHDLPKTVILSMIEINPITNQINDLRERTDSLRGYL